MAIKEHFDLSQKVALIAGGGGGIGGACAEGLADFGADVVIADILEEKINSTVTTLSRRYDVCIEGIVCDVTDVDAVEDMVTQVIDIFGGIDVLVNTVGISIHANAEDMTEQQWRKVMDTNLTSAFLCCRAVGRRMIAQNSGSIVNIASMSGQIVNVPQKQVAYNTSKAGMIQMSRSMAAEWAEHNVRVNTVSPGATITEMTDRVSEYYDQWAARTPMERLAQPEEIAGAVVYLASDAAIYTTGDDLVVDGGYTLW